MTLAAQIHQAAAELAHGAAATDPAELAALVEALATAKRIATFGCGREGLMMRALTMRLYHLGLNVHVVGDMACPPVGPGDLLLVSSGPGNLSTVATLIGQAKLAGARTACVTAQRTGPDPAACDSVLLIPAQTMADDQGATKAVLPMGSVFEGAQFLIFEILVLALRDRLGESAENMRERHTNLE
ncbi:MAG: SIS domain-containing protein [Paracoccaceae bacterium]